MTPQEKSVVDRDVAFLKQYLSGFSDEYDEEKAKRILADGLLMCESPRLRKIPLDVAFNALVIQTRKAL